MSKQPLASLSPLEAIEKWLTGDFHIGDEVALLAAIRKDARIRLSDKELIDLLFDEMDKEESNAEAVLSRLIARAVLTAK